MPISKYAKRLCDTLPNSLFLKNGLLKNWIQLESEGLI